MLSDPTRMPNIQSNPLVWLDMEMTGLDPETCVPLQVAMILTDGELNELEAIELTLWQPESALETMEPFVRKMHTTNGLLEEVRKSTTSLAQSEQQLLKLLASHCQYQHGVLCGNSIHQDRRFLNAYFPTFANYLHYRMVDVSSFKEVIRRWYGVDHQYMKSEVGAHTALADTRESINELRHYRSAFFTEL